jgi:biotin carboxyl carrier protein
MFTRKINCVFFSILALGAIATTGCNQSTPASEVDEEVVIITPVTITPVIYKSVTESINLPATTAYINKSVVRSTTTGTIEGTSVMPGEIVKKGQLLYTVRTREASAISNSLKGDSTFSFSGKINIPAAKDGVVSSISHQNGDFVQEGDELAIISDQSTLVFILDTPFEFVKFVEKNGSCTIHLPGNQMIEGKILGRLPEMDPQAQTVRYMIRPVFEGFLPSNLNAVVEIIRSTRPNSAVLPKDAVLGNETQTEFWVMKLINDTTSIKIPVKKGFENDEEVEITAPGFLKSDRIILTGGYGLPDTARIIIK